MNSKNTSETDELIDAWKQAYRPVLVLAILTLAAQACITVIQTQGNVTVEQGGGDLSPEKNRKIDFNKSETNYEQDTAKQR